MIYVDAAAGPFYESLVITGKGITLQASNATQIAVMDRCASVQPTTVAVIAPPGSRGLYATGTATSDPLKIRGFLFQDGETTSDGGNIYTSGLDVVLEDSLLWSGSADVKGGGIFVNDTYGNGIACNVGLVSPNVALDPLFTTTARGPYRLSVLSPAKDACLAGLVSEDVDDCPRPSLLNPNSDAGGLEFSAGGCP